MTNANRGTDDGAGRAPQLSIVVPAFNEDGNLQKFYEELVQVLPGIGMSWEVILVDDGSQDRTWEEITRLHARDLRIKGIRLSRNFGHQYALFSGLSQAAGGVIVSMDADLQHPPAVIPLLVDAWRAGNKIVHTIRLDGENLPFFKRLTSRLYYKIHSALSGIKVERGMADFRLLDRQVLDSLLQFREEGLFLRGLVQWVGFPSTNITFQSHERFSGTSQYTLKKMIRLAWSGITSFSTVPLRIGITVGVLTSMLAFSGIVYAFVGYLRHRTIPGWPSVIFVVSFLFGVLFILLGLIGEYIGRILIEVRGRPRYLVSEVMGIHKDRSAVGDQVSLPREKDRIPIGTGSDRGSDV